MMLTMMWPVVLPSLPMRSIIDLSVFNQIHHCVCWCVEELDLELSMRSWTVWWAVSSDCRLFQPSSVSLMASFTGSTDTSLSSIYATSSVVFIHRIWFRRWWSNSVSQSLRHCCQLTQAHIQPFNHFPGEPWLELTKQTRDWSRSCL